MKYSEIKKYNDRKFKRAVGVTRELFELLAGIIECAMIHKHKNGGRKPKLDMEDILLLTITYYRDYPTFFALQKEFCIDEANTWRWVKWTENILFEQVSQVNEENIDFDKLIYLKNEIMKTTSEYIVDVTECAIQRPKLIEVQREYYSGKKKKHTIKVQIVIDENTNKIISALFAKGSIHDMEVLEKTSNNMNTEASILGDKGYQGLNNIFKKSLTPKKKPRNKQLSDEDKTFNSLISKIRIAIEHVNCQLKIFRILSEKYRSRPKTFFKRAILICEFYNLMA